MSYPFIRTEKELMTYIKEELGYPQLNVELSDSQLHHAIEKSIQMFANFAVDGELTKYMIFKCQGAGDYMVDPQVEEIVQVATYNNNSLQGDLSGSGYIDANLSSYIYNSTSAGLTYLIQMSSTRAIMSKYMSKGINFQFISHKGLLRVFENYHGNLLVEARCQYIPDEYDKIYNHEWVKAMATAQARLLQSVILGKYSHSVVNGASINFADIRSHAENEIEKLTEELKLKWCDPAPIFIA